MNTNLSDDVNVHTTAVHRVLGAPVKDPAVHQKASEISPGSGVLEITRGPGTAGRFLLADDIVTALANFNGKVD